MHLHASLYPLHSFFFFSRRRNWKLPPISKRIAFLKIWPCPFKHRPTPLVIRDPFCVAVSTKTIFRHAKTNVAYSLWRAWILNTPPFHETIDRRKRDLGASESRWWAWLPTKQCCCFHDYAVVRCRSGLVPPRYCFQ